MRATGATYYVGLRHFRHRGLDVSHLTVRIAAPHSLQTMSAWSPLISTMRHPQQSAPSDSCGMFGSPLLMSSVSCSSPVMINVLAQHDSGASPKISFNLAFERHIRGRSGRPAEPGVPKMFRRVSGCRVPSSRDYAMNSCSSGGR